MLVFTIYIVFARDVCIFSSSRCHFLIALLQKLQIRLYATDNSI
jgi:hypothetical protein